MQSMLGGRRPKPRACGSAPSTHLWIVEPLGQFTREGELVHCAGQSDSKDLSETTPDEHKAGGGGNVFSCGESVLPAGETGTTGGDSRSTALSMATARQSGLCFGFLAGWSSSAGPDLLSVNVRRPLKPAPMGTTPACQCYVCARFTFPAHPTTVRRKRSACRAARATPWIERVLRSTPRSPIYTAASSSRPARPMGRTESWRSSWAGDVPPSGTSSLGRQSRRWFCDLSAMLRGAKMGLTGGGRSC